VFDFFFSSGPAGRKTGERVVARAPAGCAQLRGGSAGRWLRTASEMLGDEAEARRGDSAYGRDKEEDEDEDVEEFFSRMTVLRMTEGAVGEGRRSR